MNDTIQLPNLDETREVILRRWNEMLAEKELAQVGERIATDSFGQAIVSHQLAGCHSWRQGWVISRMPRLMGVGEIWVEFISPSNSAAEMEAQRRLFFLAGAIEYWQCDLQGRMSDYSNPTSNIESRVLCPSFPATVPD